MILSNDVGVNCRGQMSAKTLHVEGLIADFCHVVSSSVSCWTRLLLDFKDMGRRGIRRGRNDHEMWVVSWVAWEDPNWVMFDRVTNVVQSLVEQLRARGHRNSRDTRINFSDEIVANDKYTALAPWVVWKWGSVFSSSIREKRMDDLFRTEAYLLQRTEISLHTHII